MEGRTEVTTQQTEGKAVDKDLQREFFSADVLLSVGLIDALVTKGVLSKAEISGGIDRALSEIGPENFGRLAIAIADLVKAEMLG